MSEGAITAVSIVIVALIGMLSGTAWLNRKNLARLTSAQAKETDVKAIEITDRIAREWLKDLESKVKNLDDKLEREMRVRRAAVAFIERLLDWIGDRHPDPPEDLPHIPPDLVDYIGQ